MGIFGGFRVLECRVCPVPHAPLFLVLRFMMTTFTGWCSGSCTSSSKSSSHLHAARVSF